VQINFSLLPIDRKCAKPERRQNNEERRALGEVLIHSKEMNERRHDDDAPADSHDSDEYSDGES
jgi:hypothetical protein